MPVCPQLLLLGLVVVAQVPDLSKIDADWSGPPPPGFKTDGSALEDDMTFSPGAISDLDKASAFDAVPESMQKFGRDDDGGIIGSDLKPKNLLWGDRTDPRTQTRAVADKKPASRANPHPRGLDDSSDEKHSSFYVSRKRDETVKQIGVSSLRASAMPFEDDSDGGDEEPDTSNPSDNPMSLIPTPARTAHPRAVISQNVIRAHKKSGKQKRKGKHAAKDVEAQQLIQLIASQAENNIPGLAETVGRGDVQDGLENLLSFAETGKPKDESMQGVVNVIKAIASAAVNSDATVAHKVGELKREKSLDAIQNLLQLETKNTATATSGAGGGGAGSANPLVPILLPMFQSWIKDFVSEIVPTPVNEITNQALGAWRPPQEKTYVTQAPIQAPPFNPRPASPPPIFPMPQRMRMDDVEMSLLTGKGMPEYRPRTYDPRFQYFEELQPRADKEWDKFRQRGGPPDMPFTPSSLPDGDQMHGFPRQPGAPMRIGDQGDPPDHERNPASLLLPYPGIYLQLEEEYVVGCGE